MTRERGRKLTGLAAYRAAFMLGARAWLRSAFLDNVALKVVALAMAIGLFVVINTSEERVINVWHDVDYTRPDDRVLMSEPVSKVRLTIQGSWRRIRRFDERELQPIKVNLDALQASEYVFSQADIKLPKGLQLLAVDPPSIRLDYELKVSKDMAVNASTVGRPRTGFAVTKIAVEPTMVEVTGAKSAIEKLEALPTLELDVTDRAMPFEVVDMPLHLPPAVIESSVQNVTVRVTIEPILVDRTIEVPVVIKPAANLTLLQAQERFQVEPAVVRVKLRGPQHRLDAFAAETLEAYVEVTAEAFENRAARDLPVRLRNAPADVEYKVEPRTVHLVQKTTRPSGQQ